MTISHLLPVKHHMAKFPFPEFLVIHSNSSKTQKLKLLVGFIICFSNIERAVNLLFAVICIAHYVPLTLLTIIRVQGKILDSKITLMLSQATGWKMLA